MRRIIITTGGTGGHIFPALAVAEEIRGRYPDCEILFVGGLKGPEAEMAARAKVNFSGLPAKGVLGRGARGLSALFWIGRGMIGARRIIKRFKPQVVVGFGGYASFCPLYMAWRMGVPTAIHEQNSVPGFVNRIMGRRVDMVMISFPDEGLNHPSEVKALTGNPVRKEIADLAGRAVFSTEPGPPRLLVVGGSQGAMALNSAVAEALPKLMAAGVRLKHQTGKADLERVRGLYEEAGADPETPQPFIQEMAEAYEWADLVLCRAGATTVAELTAAGRPSVLVPFPYATHDHQSLNANFLACRGAGVMLTESALKSLGLAGTVLPLLKDREHLATMAEAARSLGVPDAAENVADCLDRLADEK